MLLDKVFGKMALGEITPADVKGYMRPRPAISGTREKALLSALFKLRSRRRHDQRAESLCRSQRHKSEARHLRLRHVRGGLGSR
jgi:hypothetical protein